MKITNLPFFSRLPARPLFKSGAVLFAAIGLAVGSVPAQDVTETPDPDPPETREAPADSAPAPAEPPAPPTPVVPEPEPPSPAPATEPSEPVAEGEDEREIIPVERSVYVPFEDLEKIFEDEGRGVFLPYREFLELWNQLNIQKDEDKEKPPADGVLASANYTATVEGDENQVLAIDAVLQVESFKEKGWAVVPLIKSGLNIAEAETGDATIHLGKNGYELILPKKGQYEIKLRLYSKIQRSSGRHTVGINLPKAGVSKFEAVLPEQGWEFDIQPGAAYSSEDLDDGTSKLAFFFGETEHFDITWQKQGEETKLTPLLFVDTNLTASVIPGALQTNAVLNYRILRAGVDAFNITVPSGHEVLGVSGDNIKEWDVQDQDGGQNLKVSLHASAKQNYILTLNLEQALDALPTEFDVPQITAGEVVRQRGSISLHNQNELEVETVSSEGLTQQSLAGVQTPGGMRTYGRFRFLTMPFGMSLSVKKAEPEVEVESWTRFTIEPDSARFQTSFNYTVKRVGIFDTRITIPADFEGVEATGSIVEDYSEETAEDGTRTLSVKFRNRSEGTFSFNVTGRLVRADAEDDATVPVFGPQDVQRHEGKVGLEIHTSLDPNTKDAGDLRQQEVSLLQGQSPAPPMNNMPNQAAQQVSMPAPPPTGIPGSGPLQIGFRYRGSEAAPAVIGFKLKEPQVNGEVFTLVDVREQLVRYEWKIAYNVLYAGVDTFVFSLPEDIANDLRVDGAIIKETDKEFAEEGLEAGEGRKLWAVILRDKRMGNYELTLSLDRPLSEASAAAADPAAGDEEKAGPNSGGRHFEIEMPEVKLEKVFREIGQVAVIKDDNLEILDAEASALEQVDPKELRGGLGREGVFLAYKYRRHPLALTLNVSRNEFLAVPKAIVTYADLTTVVSNDKAVTTEVVYWVRNNGQQFFSVSLPEGGEMVSDIYVNGEPQQPMRRADEDVVLIRLPSGGGQVAEVFPVRYVFEISSPNPGDKLGWLGSIRVHPADLTETDVLQSQITLWLPQDYIYRSFESAMRLPMNERGWTRFRGAFDWLIPSLGPQIPISGGQRWEAPPQLPSGAKSGFDFQIPKEGQRFHLHRLDAPAEIKVGFRSKGYAFFVEAFFCLLAFAVGIWLLTRPVLWRFGYFAGVGLLSLIIGGAVSPTSASFWKAIFLGVLLAAIVWLVLGCLKLLKGGGGKLGDWYRRNQEKQKKQEAQAAQLAERRAEARAAKADAEADESTNKDDEEK